MPIRIGGDLGLRKIFGGGGSGTFGPGITIGTNIPFGVNAVNLPDVGKARTTPDNQINRIISHAKRDGMYSRPTLFKMVMFPPAKLLEDWGLEQIRKMGFNCNQISIPGGNITTKPIKTYGLKKEYAYDKIFDEIASSFYMSEQMDEYNFFESWQQLMYQDNQSIGWYDDYVGTIEIHQLSRDVSIGTSNDLGTVVKYTLVDAFPKTMTQLALDYTASNTIQRMGITWTYRDVKIEPVKSRRTGGRRSLFQNLNPLEKKFRLFRDFNVNARTRGANVRFT